MALEHTGDPEPNKSIGRDLAAFTVGVLCAGREEAVLRNFVLVPSLRMMNREQLIDQFARAQPRLACVTFEWNGVLAVASWESCQPGDLLMQNVSQSTPSHEGPGAGTPGHDQNLSVLLRQSGGETLALSHSMFADWRTYVHLPFHDWSLQRPDGAAVQALELRVHARR